MRPARLFTVVRGLWHARPVLALAMLCLTLSIDGCAESTVEPGVPARVDTDPDLARFALAASVPYGSEYYWSHGDPRTYMGPDTENGSRRVCFLTGISGEFASWQDAVYVQRLAQGWYLGGSSTSSGVGARARCMTVLEFSPEIGATGVSDVSLNRDWNWMCFLTGVRGELAGNGLYESQDWVTLIAPSPYPWGLFVDGRGGSTTQLWAGARCARPLDGDADDLSPFPLVWYADEGPLALTNTNTSICALRSLHGSFRSPSSYAAIYRVPFTNTWWMSGGNIGPGHTRWVTASCFRW